jgi:hypothetical protein
VAVQIVEDNAESVVEGVKDVLFTRIESDLRHRLKQLHARLLVKKPGKHPVFFRLYKKACAKVAELMQRAAALHHPDEPAQSARKRRDEQRALRELIGELRACRHHLLSPTTSAAVMVPSAGAPPPGEQPPGQTL